MLLETGLVYAMPCLLIGALNKVARASHFVEPPLLPTVRPESSPGVRDEYVQRRGRFSASGYGPVHILEQRERTSMALPTNLKARSNVLIRSVVTDKSHFIYTSAFHEAHVAVVACEPC